MAQGNRPDAARQRGDGLNTYVSWPRSLDEGVTGAGACGQNRSHEGFQRSVDWYSANRSWLAGIRI